MRFALTVSARRLRILQKLSIAIIGAVCFASVARAQSAPPATTSPDEWEFNVTPYVFLPRLKGTIGVVGETAEVNASFSDIFRNLDFAAMGTFEARKRNWSVLVDGMYMSLSGQKVTPSPFFSDIDVEVKEIVVTPQVGYRVVRTERGSIDLLA